MKFSTNSAIDKSTLKTLGKKLQPEIVRMRVATHDSLYASVLLPGDMELLRKTQLLVKEKKKLKPKLILVVGIGGSNLGTIAVQEAILGKMHNMHAMPKIMYADTVDSDSLATMVQLTNQALKNKQEVILVGISKSGGTTETIANFEVLLNVLKKRRKNYAKYVVVISGEGSNYWKLAEEEGFSVLPIPEKVGGRYSVLSPVGLFPLGMMGINISALLKGAEQARKNNLKATSPAAVSAETLFAVQKKGIRIHDHFLFSNDLESLGKWYRQLMGESVGKERNKKNIIINAGMTPTVSMGSTDLHSMAQLYLGGPYDKMTTFVSVKPNTKVKVPQMKAYNKLVPKIQGKKLEYLMDAILKGTIAAFKKGKRPFMHITLAKKSEKEVGAFLQMKMMEMMYLGFLMNVNPFDQPAVEKYKIETKRILN